MDRHRREISSQALRWRGDSTKPLPLAGGVWGGHVERRNFKTGPPPTPPASGRGEEGYIPNSFASDFSSMKNRSEEHTSELQSLMRISYAVFCLKKKKTKITINTYLTSSEDDTSLSSTNKQQKL